MSQSRSPATQACSVLQNIVLDTTSRRPGRLRGDPPDEPAGMPALRESPDQRQTRLAQQACEDGYQEGYEQGQRLGLQQGRQVGHEEGYAQGLAEARDSAQKTLESANRDAAQELAARLARLDQIVAGVEQELAARLQAAEDDMVALSFQALCQILGREGAEPDAVRAQIRLAIAHWKQQLALEIRLHPADHQLLHQMLSEYQPELERRLSFSADPAVQLGGCLVHSAEGGLDARLEVQIEQLRQCLLSVRQRRQGAATTGAR